MRIDGTRSVAFGMTLTLGFRLAGEGWGAEAPASRAMWLQDAQRDKVCVVERVADVPFNSRYMRFTLTPLTGRKETVRIEPGWNLTARNPPGRSVTVLPAEVRLLEQNRCTVDVPSVEVEHAHYGAMEYAMVGLATNDPLYGLIRAGNATNPPPSWNAFQLAAWILTHDMDLKALRKQRYSAPQYTENVIILDGGGGYVAPDVGPLDEALALLRAAGHDAAKFKVSADLRTTFETAMKDYRDGKKSLQALETLGFFRTRPEAHAMLISVWKERLNDKTYYRECAFRWLAGLLVDYVPNPPVVNGRVFEELQQAAAVEPDADLKKDMTRRLDAAAATRARGVQQGTPGTK